jgi:hypothetical protein
MFIDKYEALRTEEDVHVLTGALKLFLRELSEPIFPQSSGKEFMSAISMSWIIHLKIKSTNKIINSQFRRAKHETEISNH